jgi:hypothetical protein
VDAYEFVLINGQKTKFVLLKSRMDQTQKTYEPNAVFNVALCNFESGKFLVDFDQNNIAFNPNDGLFLVNPAQGKPYVLNDKDEKNIFNFEHPVRYCPLGYYYAQNKNSENENSALQMASTIFDMQENPVHSFKNHELKYVIDSDTFVVNYPNSNTGYPSDGFQIINKKGEINYKDENGGISEYRPYYLNNKPYFYLSGAQGTGDSESLLLKNKKGKWINPFEHMLKNYYFPKITLLSEKTQISDYAKDEPAAYLLAFPNDPNYESTEYLGLIVNIEGKILFRLENAPRAEYVNMDSEFIYIYDTDRHFYSVFTKAGKKITKSGFLAVPIPEALKNDYAVFSNPFLKETFFYQKSTGRIESLWEYIFIIDDEQIFKDVFVTE